MQIHRIVSGPLEANCYIIWDEKTLEGAVIDPGQKNPELLTFLETCPAKIRYIIATHGHFDHMLYTYDVLQKIKAEVVVHKLDAAAFSDDSVNLFHLYTCRTSKHLTPDVLVCQGDSLALGGITLTFLDTPGHTPGSMCIVAREEGNPQKVMFSGDTLFRLDIGRADLPRGNQSALTASLHKLSLLEEDFRVLPGHLEETTLAWEKRDNPYLK